jgi:hypothetical protein
MRSVLVVPVAKAMDGRERPAASTKHATPPQAGAVCMKTACSTRNSATTTLPGSITIELARSFRKPRPAAIEGICPVILYFIQNLYLTGPLSWTIIVHGWRSMLAQVNRQRNNFILRYCFILFFNVHKTV